MPESAGPEQLPGRAQDQASGLRRMFEQAPHGWTLVLQPSMRCALVAEALAQRSRRLAAAGGATLVIDAARTQLASALGLRLRFDLEHALAGDCDTGDACVGVDESLWVLPAARAVDLAYADERHGRRVAAALGLVAAQMRQVLLVLPAGRVSWVRTLSASVRFGHALIPVSHGADASASVLTAVRQAVSDAQIDTFHLLFLGMGEAAAGRLLSGMAAIAQRHFGATLLAAKPVADAPFAPAAAFDRRRSVETVL